MGFDTVGYQYNTDAGETVWFSPFYTLHDSTTINEFSIAIEANKGGKFWNMTFTGDHHVFFAQRPQDLSYGWFASTTPIDDADHASHVYSAKGIASHWDTHVPYISWSDYRDGSPYYDIYVDHYGDDHSLLADTYGVPIYTGGSVNFSLDAGTGLKKSMYVMLGSVSGTYPGIYMPGGGPALPIKWDWMTDFVIGNFNQYFCQDFFGVLDSNGMATAQFNIGPTPLVYDTYVFHFAYGVYNFGWKFASNPVTVVLIE
jgi:hypothetical protein